MPLRAGYIPRGSGQEAYGKMLKGFTTYLGLAGKEMSRYTAKKLVDSGQEFLDNEDWDWPRGQRYTTSYLGKEIRASKSYASGFRGGDDMHPWYSGNLHDSMAVAVMDGTRILASRFMKPGASSNQTYKDRVVFGADEAMKALQRAAHTFVGGEGGGLSNNTIRTVMVIGVPYADKVNESDKIGWGNSPNTHNGYADYLGKAFYSSMLPAVERACKATLKLK